MEKRQLKIDILGASFTIQSEESPGHLSRVESLLRQKVEEVKNRYSFADPLTVALLAGLNLADELVQERDGRGTALPHEVENLARKIMDGMDDELLSRAPYGEDVNPSPSAK